MIRPLALAVLALAIAAPTAQAGDVQVVNQRGLPQAALWTDGDGLPNRPTDDDGRITDLPAGTRVRVTRSTSTSPCFRNQGGAPEGPDGMAIDVPETGTATLVLPNATGDSFQPGSDDAERWIVGQINQRRAERGKPPVRISAILGRAADAVARAQAVRSLSFPPPFCPVVVADWGFPGRAAYTLVGLDAGGRDPRAAWAHWSDGSPRETSGTLGDWNAVGIGNGDGAWAAYFASCPPERDARCELSGDQGDPTIALPPPPPSGGDGTKPPSGGDGTKPPSQPGTGPGTDPGSPDAGAAPALRALKVARRQRGRAVKATVDVAQAGSHVAARLRRGGRVVGKATARDVAAGRTTLRVKLSRSARKALEARRKLRLTLEVVVDPPAGKSETARRAVTLRR